ncbi:MAG: hypothetical protein GEU90_20120 [Gemmatimonas sp.]|nr:hypothetical protein [Gemmatimonas sp.]
MDSTEIKPSYNRGLRPLEELLDGVRRSGDFFVRGTLEMPMPRVDVVGVGTISFPVPEAQVSEIIAEAERAPYGRGEDTIVDGSVRNTWQLAASRVRVGGKSWDRYFQQILSMVTNGLGCADLHVSAELYKLLAYEEGGFFKAHRDTEKADGMFATLVVVLPSSHRGGELVVRHAGREVILDLSSDEVSEVSFAAFYADCEHEVRPVTGGNRICLVYNLIQQRRGGKDDRRLTAPLYETEAVRAAEMLEGAFNEGGGPRKLAWLLEHQYSPAELSFAGLKGEDAARAGVLLHAADQARCAAHLALVHIEESGIAQPLHDDYHRGSRWRGYDFEEEVQVDSDEFEVIEVCDSREFFDHWIDPGDRAVEFGELPLGEGELLPAGALDGAEPDEQRLTEATGNEGASFERSYHCSAVVVWPKAGFAEVLLQAGVGAAVPYLADCVRACEGAVAPAIERERTVAIADRILAVWEAEPAYRLYAGGGRKANRSEMLALLGAIADPELLERFVDAIVIRDYDGSENGALAGQMHLLGARQAGDLLSRLARENTRECVASCVDLLSRLGRANGHEAPAVSTSALRKMAEAIIEVLPEVLPRGTLSAADPRQARKAQAADASTLADLLDSFTRLGLISLRVRAARAVIANVPVFDPGEVIVPALELLRQRRSGSSQRDADFHLLWRHTAAFLLARSEFPPHPPADWRQDVAISCACDDCRELQAFARRAGEEVHRFRVRKDRRQHLHHAIQSNGLDMTHVTERKGSPQTLVCRKTLRRFQARCVQHTKDIAALGRLSQLIDVDAGAYTSDRDRIAAALARAPRPFSPPSQPTPTP